MAIRMVVPRLMEQTSVSWCSFRTWRFLRRGYLVAERAIVRGVCNRHHLPPDDLKSQIQWRKGGNTKFKCARTETINRMRNLIDRTIRLEPTTTRKSSPQRISLTTPSIAFATPTADMKMVIRNGIAEDFMVLYFSFLFCSVLFFVQSMNDLISLLVVRICVNVVVTLTTTNNSSDALNFFLVLVFEGERD